MDEAMKNAIAIQKRCETILAERCVNGGDPHVYLYRAAYADGQRAGMERAAGITENTFPYAATDAERLALHQLLRAAQQIRQAAGEVTGG